jgi:hypothetical protein
MDQLRSNSELYINIKLENDKLKEKLKNIDDPYNSNSIKQDSMEEQNDHDVHIVPDIKIINKNNKRKYNSYNEIIDNSRDVKGNPKINGSKQFGTENDNLNIGEDIKKEKKLKIKKEIIIDSELPFPKCPIVTINTKDDMETVDWKKHVSTEIFRIIEDNSNLHNMIDKDNTIDKNTLDDAVVFIIKKRKIEDIKQNRKYIRDSIKRSTILYNKYKEELKNISFSFRSIVKLSEKNWDKFLIYFDTIIKKVRQSSYQKIENNNINDDINIIKPVDINEINNEGPSTPIPDLSNFKFNFKPNKKKKQIIKEDNIDNKCSNCFKRLKQKESLICNKCIKEEFKKKNKIPEPGDSNYNVLLCLSCQTNERTNSSFCNSCIL